MDDQVEELVKKIEIPPCPAILTRIVREMQEDDPDLNKIAQGVSADVALAAAVLKTVNSPFYGLRNKANSVQQALILLGLRNVGQLVTGLLLRQAFPTGSGEVMERFWAASVVQAVATSIVARHTRICDPHLAYTFGLFRDAGMPALLNKYKDYSAVMTGEATLPGVPITTLETQRFGVNHAQVGAYFARSWHLDEAEWLGILLHHDYSKWALRGVGDMAAQLAAMALVAEQIHARHEADDDCAEWELGGEAAMSLLEIGADDLLGMQESLAEALTPETLDA